MIQHHKQVFLGNLRCILPELHAINKRYDNTAQCQHRHVHSLRMVWSLV